MEQKITNAKNVITLLVLLFLPNRQGSLKEVVCHYA